MQKLNSLRWRLLLLVALAIAPMAAMTVVVGVRERERALISARDNLQRLTNLAAANEAQSIKGAMQILRDLSSLSSLRRDPAACNALMQGILAKNNEYVNFGLIELDGNVSCSAVPMTALVNLGDRAHFKRAVLEKRFIAGGYVFGRVVRRHTVNVTYPVMDGKAVSAVLFAAIDLVELDRFVADVKLPDGSRLWTVDNEGTIISRRPNPLKWFGKKVSQQLAQLAATRPAPMVVLDSDGIERLYASARVGTSELSDYSVLIGIPQDSILAGARNDQRFALAGLFITVLLAGLAAWIGGDALIVQRVRRLAQTANRIASGSLSTRTGMRYNNEEISELARSLDEMAQALEMKEAQRDAAQAELVNADRRKDEFLAMLAHELRNPLAPISSGAHVLQMTRGENPIVARTAEIIARQTTHMTRLIDDLLDVSRVTRGLVTLSADVLEVRNIVRAAVEQIEPIITRKDQRLEVIIADRACMIVGDYKRMVQIVANVLGNSAKYTQDGGRIRLEVECSESDAVIIVSDNGIGMTEELVSRVFEMFAQGERSSDRSQGGLGLGLALVRTLVGLHGGFVTAASAGMGLGSNFTIRIPLAIGSIGNVCSALASNENSDVVGTAIVASGLALRCLLVDDNEDAVHMLAHSLRDGGHDVLIAHNAAHAMELARANAFDACLLDIGLPDIDGNALAALLRSTPGTAQALLVAVSGYGRREDMATSLAAGFDHYVVKPVEMSSLLRLLSDRLLQKG